MGKRLRHKRSLAIVGLLGITTGLAVPGAHASVAPSLGTAVVSFEAQLDGNLVNGSWSLVRRIRGTPGGTALQSGRISPAGRLSAAVPRTLIRPEQGALSAEPGTAGDRDYQFLLIGYKSVDATHAYLTVGLVGLPESQLGAQSVIEFGALSSQLVVTYPSAAEAAAASQCGARCGTTATSSQSAAGLGPESLVPASIPVATGDSSITQTSSPAALGETLGVPSPQPPTSTANPTADLPAPAALGCIILPDGTRICTDAEAEIHGVQAFRGWSHRVNGVHSTFTVEQLNTQRWQNGFRSSAGAFAINGTTDRSVGMGSTITWPVRGDCWDPPALGDLPCSFVGWESKWGLDSWHWEKDTVCTPDFLCNSIELLFETSYDGGANTGNNSTFDYYAAPSQIRSGAKGKWANYPPGSRVSTFLETIVEYTSSASININFPESFGAVTFSSSMSNQTLTRTTIAHTIRPTTELPFMGNTYRYDGGDTPWRSERWSCEWAPGYATSVCWADGS